MIEKSAVLPSAGRWSALLDRDAGVVRA